MKYTRFQDVQQFTRSGTWECDFSMDFLVPTLQEWEETMGLDLNPDFQRGHVWTKKQQTAWLEFFLKGGKTSRVLYFNNASCGRIQSTWKPGDFVIVDGKQRLHAITCFLNNEIKVFGSYFREFTDSLRFTQTLRVNVNDLETRAEVLQWYLDHNSGGVVHSGDELSRVRKLLAAEKRKST